MTDVDDDQLDGICDFDAPMLKLTLDGDEVLGLVLFADIDWTNPTAVAHRRDEWLALFPHRRGWGGRHVRRRDR